MFQYFSETKTLTLPKPEKKLKTSLGKSNRIMFLMFLLLMTTTNLVKKKKKKFNSHLFSLPTFTVIQYGYLTLFAACLPVAPILALVNNVIEIKTDAIKYVKNMQRPNYRGAQDIGVW